MLLEYVGNFLENACLKNECISKHGDLLKIWVIFPGLSFFMTYFMEVLLITFSKIPFPSVKLYYITVHASLMVSSHTVFSVPYTK